MRASILFLGVLAAGVLGIPAPSDYVVHERRDALPREWDTEMPLDKRTVLPMRIGLAQSNLDRGHDLLMEMYVPYSLLYGDGTDGAAPTPDPISMPSTSLPRRCMTSLLPRRAVSMRSAPG